MVQLDFSLNTTKERRDYAEKYIENNKEKAFSENDLETIANYILYGKDSDSGESIVDRKEVQIKTKYNSYSKKEPESLDELMESAQSEAITIVPIWTGSICDCSFTCTLVGFISAVRKGYPK